MSPADLEHWQHATAWLTLGNVQECFDALERIAPANRMQPVVLEARTDMYIKARKWDHAMPIVETLYSEFPEDPRVTYKLAIVALNVGQKERAEDLMEKAIENGGNPVRLDALNDPNAEGLWVT